jgi:hypothetical protein
VDFLTNGRQISGVKRSTSGKTRCRTTGSLIALALYACQVDAETQGIARIGLLVFGLI